MCECSWSQPRGRLIDVTQAVGTILAHDMTEITPGEKKGPAFKKGHVVKPTDLDHLARMGKNHLYVLDLDPTMMHEDEAALALAQALAGDGVTFNPNPSEGKVNLMAARPGMLKVNVGALTEFNMVDGVMCASRHTFSLVQEDDLLAGTRAIPLVIPRENVDQAVQIARDAGGVFSVCSLGSPLCGIVVTGSEVFTGLIEDRFVPALRPKIQAFGCRMLPPIFAPDDVERISAAILDLLDRGAELIVTTGGMSVDPDDVTRLGVVQAGGEDLLYGSSVLPGAMLLLARIRGVPVIGVPACGMFHDQTIFDLVLPRILAGDVLTPRDLASLAHGGLCLNCPKCHYPACPFGKSGL